jgi:two-component system, response regulator PdtaR
MQHHACNRPLVLVVEDEVLLRWATAEAVQAAGFAVIEAENAIEAISILEKRTDISAVFTDVQMPGSINGLQLAHLISSRWPPIGIIATSGQLRLREDDLPKGGRYLQKPYPASQLADMLRELVEKQRSPEM